MVKKLPTDSGIEDGQVVCGTSKTNKNEKMDKEKTNNNGSITGSMNSAEASGCKITAASNAQDYVTVILYMSFGSEELSLVVVDNCTTTTSLLEQVEWVLLIFCRYVFL